MPFMIETTDKPDGAPVRQANREAHLAFLAQEAAKLIACGAKLNDEGTAAIGSVYIVDLETREAARAFVESDPFAKAGLFGEIRITRWRKAYLDGVSYL